MDQLIAQSHIWTNYYAAGQRSIFGIQAALTSVPALPDQANIGFGLEMNDMTRIGKIASHYGYRSIMMQTSKRHSFNIDAVAKALGFQEYYGKEDISIIKDYPQKTPYFGWDYDSLIFLANQINRTPEQPFFAFLFTGTTHEKFATVYGICSKTTMV